VVGGSSPFSVKAITYRAFFGGRWDLFKFLSLESLCRKNKPVIPDERRAAYGDPESREMASSRLLLDPGSHPAPRDLAGMTNWDTAFQGGGKSLVVNGMPARERGRFTIHTFIANIQGECELYFRSEMLRAYSIQNGVGGSSRGRNR
jgi:hypothetical protein